MMNSRDLGNGATLYQIIEVHGPTHDAQWMLPGLPENLMASNVDWLEPSFWMNHTNRLVFTFQLWIVKFRDRIVVIDTGIGNGKKRVAPSQHMVNTPVLDWLAAIGASPGDVTHVINTHLHGDHVGWNTQWVDGRWEPVFPNARYYMPRINWEVYKQRLDAQSLPDVFRLPVEDSVVPIVEHGLATMVDHGDDVAGFEAIHAHGHTPGNMIFSLRHAGEEFIFSGDVIHCPIQILKPEINSRWCEDQPAAREARQMLLKRAALSGANIIPAHAKSMEGWRVSAGRNGGFLLDIAEKAMAERREPIPA